MVWFQCEDCGENLKKPKLPNHFRMCRATKLSCIDCGVMFGRDSVQSHNQCITEAEKYGPKGKSKPPSNGTPAKQQQAADFDINVGLSNRYPWFCSLCNTKATSQQTLLAHADGKKHRTKAKGFHAKQNQESGQATVLVDDKDASETTCNGELEQKKEELPVDNKRNIEETLDETSNGEAVQSEGRQVKKAKKDEEHEKEINWKILEHNKEDLPVEKKRKIEETVDQTGNGGEAFQLEGGRVKKAKKHEKKIKWKKLITSALKSNEDKTLKMKKLKKLVMESLVDSGVTRDKSHVNAEIKLKLNSSSRFQVDGKYVKLVAKD